MSGSFWLTDQHPVRFERYKPTDARGKPRVDNRRMIGGIVYVLKTGSLWSDAPALFATHKKPNARLVGWVENGVWTDIFVALARAGGLPAAVLLELAAVRTHRYAAEGGGRAEAQAIGRSRGRRIPKVAALSDSQCRVLTSCWQVCDGSGSPLFDTLCARGARGSPSHLDHRQALQRTG